VRSVRGVCDKLHAGECGRADDESAAVDTYYPRIPRMVSSALVSAQPIVNRGGSMTYFHDRRNDCAFPDRDGPRRSGAAGRGRHGERLRERDEVRRK